MATALQAPQSETPWADLVTHDGLFSIDSRQRIVQWSDSAQRLLGMKREDVVGKPCYEVIGGRDARNYRFCRRNCPVLLSARRGRATPDYDILCTVSGGEDRWLNISVAIPKRTRWPFQVIHMFRDVTDRRRTEDFARKAGTALRELLGEDGEDKTSRTNGSPPPVPALSRREMESLRLLAAGLSTAQIAETLGVRPITARNHITRVLNKLGVESRLQAVVFASQHGLI
ncbi:MAG: PAS domain-containing protein [Chloroflexi bacterium]|nr:PAS domain-containing protein [Chloroflexota bacterium]